jgi:hypothetical protein
VAKVEPLTETEEVLWRSLRRLVITLPRALRGENSASLIWLKLRHCLSARMSRLLDDLQARQLILKRRSETDGRGNIACLTRQGLAALKSAYPEHLASVRRLVMDHIDDADKARTARVLEAVATSVDESAMWHRT